MNLVEFQDGKNRKKKADVQVLDGENDFFQEESNDVGNQNMPGMQFETGFADEVDASKGKKKKKKQKKAVRRDDEDDMTADMNTVDYETMQMREKEQMELELQQRQQE